MIKSGKKQKKSIFFQGGWEIAAFFYYISTKKLLPYGQQLFCAEGALFGICHNSRKVISLNPTYARARLRAVRARARGASAWERVRARARGASGASAARVDQILENIHTTRT